MVSNSVFLLCLVCISRFAFNLLSINHSLSLEAGQSNDDSDYATLMDRFRSRLVIPILDEDGHHVIAFGGRQLDSMYVDGDDGDKKSFKAAKYINSPDSLVFTKKNILFNRHKAKVAIEDNSTVKNSPDKKSSHSTTFSMPPPVIIVEGYFDAIALSNVGVRNVVASMGTALPFEQLKIAAEIGGVPGGEFWLYNAWLVQA